jgi:two-component system LytT family response regulator
MFMEKNGLKAILIDDEQENLNGLRLKLQMACPMVEVMAAFSQPDLALQVLSTNPPDIVFLDVEMPGMNGFALLEALPNRSFEVIMTTGYSEFGIQAIKANAIDYLLKPIDIEELQTAVNKVAAKKQSDSTLDKKMDALSNILKAGQQQTGKITLHSSREAYFVQVSQIIRVAAENNYSIFYLANGKKITVSKTLGEFEDILTPQNFFRIHKSHLINLNYLVKLTKTDSPVVIMTDGSEIEVSARRKADFLRMMEG